MRATSIAKALHYLPGKLGLAPSHMKVISTWVITLKALTRRISPWLENNQRKPSESDELLPELSEMLETCTTLLQLIEELLSKTTLGGSDANSFSRTKYLCNESTINVLQQLLRDQVQAGSVILQCLQL